MNETWRREGVSAAAATLLREALRARGATFEERSIGGFRTHLVHAGKGEASLVWFPAAGDTAYSFGPVQLALAARLRGRARVIAVDPPGHGGSPAPEGGLEMCVFPELHAWAAALFAALSPSGEALIAAGNSSGAAIATGGAATAGARVAGLIFVAWTDWRSGGCPTCDDLCPGDLAALRRLLERSFHRPPAVTGSAAARLLERLGSPAVRRHVESFDPGSYSALLDRCLAPLAIIGGRSDRLVPPPLIELAAGARAGTEVRWLDACGHHPHREKPGELVTHLAELTDRFLAPNASTLFRGASHGAV